MFAMLAATCGLSATTPHLTMIIVFTGITPGQSIPFYTLWSYHWTCWTRTRGRISNQTHETLVVVLWGCERKFLIFVIISHLTGHQSSYPFKAQDWKCFDQTSTGGCGSCWEKCCRESQKSATGKHSLEVWGFQFVRLGIFFFFSLPSEPT